MQRIPVDMGRLGPVLCVAEPEPKLNPETGEVRRDRDGNPVWVVVVAVRQLQNRRADILEIAVPGQPTGLAEGVRVTVTDLVAIGWEIDGRKGTTFKASAVVAAGAPATARGKAAGGEG